MMTRPVEIRLDYSEYAPFTVKFLAQEMRREETLLRGDWIEYRTAHLLLSICATLI